MSHSSDRQLPGQTRRQALVPELDRYFAQAVLVAQLSYSYL